jgi:hypothetical protein
MWCYLVVLLLQNVLFHDLKGNRKKEENNWIETKKQEERNEYENENKYLQ